MGIKPVYVGKTELPYDEGEHTGDAVYAPDEIGRSGRWTLTGMEGDHDFFSSYLMTSVGLVGDPVEIFWSENSIDKKEAPYELVMDKVVLKGLPAPYSHTVYACPKEHSKKLFSFLDRVSVSRTDGVWDSVHQAFPIIDWKLVETLSVVPNAPPTVTLHSWGWEAKDFIVCYRLSRDQWNNPPTLCQFPKSKPRVPPKARG